MITRGKLSIIVSGMIASDPYQGGATWAVLQYILGFRRLGHEVIFIEPIQSQAIRPSGAAFASSKNARYFCDVIAEFGLERNAALLLSGTQETVGLPYETLRAAAQRAHLLINLSGLLTDEALLSPIPVRAYLDLDPAFNQLWSAVHGIDMRFSAHTHFFTIGLLLGDPICPIPTCGLSWRRMLPPVVLDFWAPAAQPGAHLTTIGNFRAYGSIEHNGIFYGQKAHSLRKFYSLPKMTNARFVLALGIHPDEVNDLQALHANGWSIEDPIAVAGTPAKYQEFIHSSLAEFGIAKSGYTVSQCGWFSDRSACYLASGRPVIAQDTGFGRFLPTGEGLFSFKNTEDILAAINDLQEYPSQHRVRARAIAEEYFDSDKVLTCLLDIVS